MNTPPAATPPSSPPRTTSAQRIVPFRVQILRDIANLEALRAELIERLDTANAHLSTEAELALARVGLAETVQLLRETCEDLETWDAMWK